MNSFFLFLDKVLRRYTPDPFVIAIVLTVVTWLLAISTTGSSSQESIVIWGNGFWGFAKFTLQMAMILLGGYVVATSRPVQWLLLNLVRLVRSPGQAVLFCTAASMIASWINWGFGLVVGGVVAMEVGKRLPQVPFRVLVASSYSGFLVWHAGLSGSIPLAVSTESDKITQAVLGGQAIPLSQTTFGSLNLIALASIVVLLLGLNLLMLKMVASDDDSTGLTRTDDSISGKAKQAKESGRTRESAQPWLAGSTALVLMMVAMSGFYFYSQVAAGRFALNLDSVMLIFFMAGLFLHGNPSAFMNSVNEAVPKIAPILIQYPLYAGIMALLIETGLAEQMSQFFVKISTADTLPLMTFYSAGLVNLFVPSGGGQWGVQAPIVIPAAQQLGADVSKTIMAVAWGDAWTNMLQPFWAVPLLTIAGLKIKDIIGLLLIVLLTSGVVLSLVFWLL